MSDTQITIKAAVIAAGGRESVRAACELKSQQSVMKWEDKNSLPRTEFTGETNYAARIAKMCRNKGKSEFTKKALLSISRKSRRLI